MAITQIIRGIIMRNLEKERIEMQQMGSLKYLNLMGFKGQVSTFFGKLRGMYISFF